MNERILNERYSLESEIGRGGMGVVYNAKDTQLDRYVAVKVLPIEFGCNQQFVERFRREILNAAKLSHPHIAHVYDIGNDRAEPYYVMEFINGNDLHSEIKDVNGMPVDECARIISQVARALDYAHKRGIVHRDIKPENILLDSQRDAHIVDFGIAKSIEGTRLTGGVIGTPAYMSPEQGRGEDVDGHSDQYSLAIVAFEMLTGVTPFRSDVTQPWALVNMQISTAPPDPKQLRPDLPDKVCLALLRALAKNPSERFASCSDFASALMSARQMSVPAGDQIEQQFEDVGKCSQSEVVVKKGNRWIVDPRILVAIAIIALLLGGCLIAWSLHSPAKAKPKSIVTKIKHPGPVLITKKNKLIVVTEKAVPKPVAIKTVVKPPKAAVKKVSVASRPSRVVIKPHQRKPTRITKPPKVKNQKLVMRPTMLHVWVCAKSGLQPRPWCPKVMHKTRAGTLPTRLCSRCKKPK